MTTQNKFGFTLGQQVGHVIKKIQTNESPDEAYLVSCRIVGFTNQLVVIEFPNGHKKSTYPNLLKEQNG